MSSFVNRVAIGDRTDCISFDVGGWHPLAYCILHLFWPCILHSAFFLASRTAYRLTTIVGVSICIKKLKWRNIACTCTIILANVSFDVFACYISYFSTSLSQVHKWWNDPPKKRKRSERAKHLELFDFACDVCCVSWWKLDLFKIRIAVCVRYNRTFYVLRTDPWRTAYRIIFYTKYS